MGGSVSSRFNGGGGGGGGRFPRNSVDDEDHVTRCLLWIRGMKREKSMHFESRIYPPEVLASLKERAEELGLKMEVRESMMYISVHPNARKYDEVPKLSSVKLSALNEKVQAAIRDYFARVMADYRSHGCERFGLPTKGYFMRPEWVAKQVMEIGKRAGYEVLKERDGTVELYAVVPPNQGLARYFSVPDHLIPMPPSAAPQSQPAIAGTLSRSFSGGHFPPSPQLLSSHPVVFDQLTAAAAAAAAAAANQTHTSQPLGFLPDDTTTTTKFGDARLPKSVSLESSSSNSRAAAAPSQFGNADNNQHHPAPPATPIAVAPETQPPRRHRRSNHRSNPRDVGKQQHQQHYWENGGCESKVNGSFEQRGRGRGGKGRRGRGGGARNGVRASALENGDAHNHHHHHHHNSNNNSNAT